MISLFDTRQVSRLFVALVVVVAAGSIVSGAALAQSDQPDWANELYEEMGPMVDRYNENVDADDAGVAGDQLKDENVNLVVSDANGTDASVSFHMNDQLQIEELSQGTRDDATMRMSTDRATMDTIIASDTPSSAFQSAITSGDISIDGIGAVNAVKWAIINVLVSIFG